VTNNGTIAPGNSIGTLDITGEFINNPSGTLAVELAPGKGDLLRVSGTATLNGGTVRASLKPTVYADETRWSVLQAGRVDGAFNRLSFGLASATLSLDMVTTSRAVRLELSRKPYAEFGDTPVQRAIGAGLDGVVPLAVGRDDSMAELITAMDFSYSPAQITATLGQLSPEMYTAFSWACLQSNQAFGQAIDLEMDQAQDERSMTRPEAKAKGTVDKAAAPGSSASQGGWDLWARFLGARANRDGGPGSAMGYGQKLEGVIIGGHGQVAPWLNLGLAMGFSRGDLSWDRPSYYGRMENFHTNLHGAAQWGAFYARAAVQLTYHDSKAHRSIDFTGYNGTAQADFHGLSGMASLGGGYDLDLGVCRLGPTAGLRYIKLEQNGFSESGASSLGLAIADQSAESMQSSLGLRAAASWSLAGLRLMPRASAAWWHEFKDDPYQVSASFAGYNDAPFTVQGLAPPEDYLLIGAGVSALMSEALKANLELSLATGDDYQAQAVTVGIQYWF